MSAIIGAIASFLGAYFYDIDFCTMYTFVSIGISVCQEWFNHTNDKTALQ